MEIRKAVPSDMRFIITEGIKFMEYHPLSYKKDIDPKELISLTDTVIKDHIILIAEQNGKQAGVIAGIIAPNPFNTKYLGLAELMWWVKEEYRGSSHALKLLRAFEEAGKERGVDYITMVRTMYTPELDKVYKKRGYIPAETTFLKEL